MLDGFRFFRISGYLNQTEFASSAKWKPNEINYSLISTELGSRTERDCIATAWLWSKCNLSCFEREREKKEKTRIILKLLIHWKRAKWASYTTIVSPHEFQNENDNKIIFVCRYNDMKFRQKCLNKIILNKTLFPTLRLPNGSNYMLCYRIAKRFNLQTKKEIYTQFVVHMPEQNLSHLLIIMVAWNIHEKSRVETVNISNLLLVIVHQRKESLLSFPLTIIDLRCSGNDNAYIDEWYEATGNRIRFNWQSIIFIRKSIDFRSKKIRFKGTKLKMERTKHHKYKSTQNHRQGRGKMK